MGGRASCFRPACSDVDTGVNDGYEMNNDCEESVNTNHTRAPSKTLSFSPLKSALKQLQYRGPSAHPDEGAQVSESVAFGVKWSDVLFQSCIGRGEFGSVVCVRNRHDGTEFAVKIVCCRKRWVSETLILRRLPSCESIVKIHAAGTYVPTAGNKQSVCDGENVNEGEGASRRNPDRAAASTEGRVQKHDGSESEDDIVLTRPDEDEKAGGRVEYFFIMTELLRGPDLYERITTGTQPSESVCRLWFSHMLQAVSTCHQNGVAHRDIKASSFLFAEKSDDSSTLKLIDFGFAERLDKSSLYSRTFGSIYYTSPELLQNSDHLTWREGIKRADMYLISGF